MYAIIDVKGKQQKVTEGEIIQIDLVDKNPGDTIEFENIVCLSDGKEVKVGSPYVKDSKVIGEVLREVKGPKILVFFYRRRKGSSRKVGHREKYLEVKIKEIKTK